MKHEAIFYLSISDIIIISSSIIIIIIHSKNTHTHTPKNNTLSTKHFFFLWVKIYKRLEDDDKRSIKGYWHSHSSFKKHTLFLSWKNLLRLNLMVSLSLSLVEFSSCILNANKILWQIQLQSKSNYYYFFFMLFINEKIWTGGSIWVSEHSQKKSTK